MSFSSELIQPNEAVGGNGGGEFELIAKTGSFVKRIRVYHGFSKWGSDGQKGLLSGIELDFTDGKTATWGKLDDSGKFSECHLNVGKDEKVKSMSLYGMGDGKWDRTSELNFKTNKDQSFNAGSRLSGENEYKMDVGSGLLIGFRGRAGNIVDSLRPLFLKRVAKQYINNVEYPDLLQQDLDFLQPQYVDRQKARWDGMSSKIKMSGEIKEKEEHSITNKISLLASVTLEFMAGVPLVAEGGIKTTLSVGYEHTWASSEGREKLLRYDVEKDMKGPDDEFELLAMYRKGETSLDYTGTFNIVTEDGEHFSFPTSGTVKSVIFTQMEVVVRTYDDEGNPVDKPYAKGATRSLEDENEEIPEEGGLDDVADDVGDDEYGQEGESRDNEYEEEAEQGEEQPYDEYGQEEEQREEPADGEYEQADEQGQDPQEEQQEEEQQEEEQQEGEQQGEEPEQGYQEDEQEENQNEEENQKRGYQQEEETSWKQYEKGEEQEQNYQTDREEEKQEGYDQEEERGWGEESMDNQYQRERVEQDERSSRYNGERAQWYN